MSKCAVIIFSLLLVLTQSSIVHARVFSPTMIHLPTHSSLKVKELVAEINQNFAYFCMKKSSVFKKESHCFKHTEKIATSCRDQHKSISSKLLTCVLKKLARR
jgi:hypothetical protein